MLAWGCDQGHSPGASAAGDAAAQWNGFGGTGEYSGSNGITWRTMEAGHRIRDGQFDPSAKIADTQEHYDLVVVGGGFGGLGAMHAHTKRNPQGTCLLLDNQEVFGGYAKANEFEIGGFRVAAGQASFNFVLPQTPADRGGSLWAELGLPDKPIFAMREDGRKDIVFAPSSSGPLYFGEQTASTGYHFGEHGWRIDIWRDDLARAPLPRATRQALLAMRARRRKGAPDAAEARRLDQMTFAEFAAQDLRATPEALRYITNGMCITGSEISAYAARSFPGLERFAEGTPEAELAQRFVSFPQGNAVLARAFVAAALPEALTRDQRSGLLGRLDPAQLDQPGHGCRIRQRATVISVANEGDGVSITYERGGALYRVRGKAAVLAIGAWVVKRILKDAPADLLAAFGQYHYAPMLIANVGLRNWRFLDKLGISAARWLDGTGFYASIRQPMSGPDGMAVPFHPDNPIVMTIYVPFPRANMPLEAQCADARIELFSTPFATFERRIVAQMEQLFASAGFDARRDIAGIVLNRWGHAFLAPPPGFHFADPEKLAPADAPDQLVGRIAFARSEDWLGSALSGARAVERLTDRTLSANGR